MKFVSCARVQHVVIRSHSWGLGGRLRSHLALYFPCTISSILANAFFSVFYSVGVSGRLSGSRPDGQMVGHLLWPRLVSGSQSLMPAPSPHALTLLVTPSGWRRDAPDPAYWLCYSDLGCIVISCHKIWCWVWVILIICLRNFLRYLYDKRLGYKDVLIYRYVLLKKQDEEDDNVKLVFGAKTGSKTSVKVRSSSTSDFPRNYIYRPVNSSLSPYPLKSLLYYTIVSKLNFNKKLVTVQIANQIMTIWYMFSFRSFPNEVQLMTHLICKYSAM